MRATHAAKLGNGFSHSVAVGFSGLVSGWATAALLGKIARLGAPLKVMVPAGVVLSLVLASGAWAGVSELVGLFKKDAWRFDWHVLGEFVTSWLVVPVLVLGSLTGLYVRSRIPPPLSQSSQAVS